MSSTSLPTRLCGECVVPCVVGRPTGRILDLNCCVRRHGRYWGLLVCPCGQSESHRPLSVRVWVWVANSHKKVIMTVWCQKQSHRSDKTGFEPASSKSSGFQGHPINHSRTYPPWSLPYLKPFEPPIGQQKAAQWHKLSMKLNHQSKWQKWSPKTCWVTMISGNWLFTSPTLFMPSQANWSLPFCSCEGSTTLSW